MDTGAKSEFLTILDFDDTLVCSSWIKTMLIRSNDPQQKTLRGDIDILESIDKVAASIVYHATLNSTVVIISNAQMQWMNYCLDKIFIKLGLAARICGARIVSARDVYSAEYKDPIQWKYLAFKVEIGKFLSLITTHTYPCVFSIGDGLHECVVTSLICREFKIQYGILKFMECPTPLVLLKELELANKQLDDFIQQIRNGSQKVLTEINISECGNKSFLAFYAFMGIDMYTSAISTYCNGDNDNILGLTSVEINTLLSGGSLAAKRRVRGRYSPLSRAISITYYIASLFLLAIYFFSQVKMVSTDKDQKMPQNN